MSLENDAYLRAANIKGPSPATPVSSFPRPSKFRHPSRARRFIGLARHSQWLMVAAAAMVVSLVLVVPGYLVIRSIGVGTDGLSLMFSLRTWQVMGNTILIAIMVPVGATIIAVPLAWLTTSTDLPGRKIWTILIALPLILPSYVFAFIFISVMSPKGLMQQVLYPVLGIDKLPSVYGFPGAFLVLTLITYPLIFLTVRGAILRLDPALEEAARSLGSTPRRVFWRVTLPHLRPSILAGVLLVSLYVLRDFGAVTTLHYNTFTRIIYNRYLSYRLDVAALFASILVVMAIIILYLEQKSRGRARYASLSSSCSRQKKPVYLGKWKIPALLFSGTVVIAALGMPLLGLIYWVWRGWQGQQLSMTSGTINSNVGSILQLLGPAWNSLSASVIAALLTTILALPIAILVVRRPGRLSWFFERIAYAGYALPGIVVALAFVFFGIHLVPSLYQTLPMLLGAYVILFIPLAIGAERTVLQQISPSLEEVGRSLGQKPLAVLRRITVPLIWPGFMGAMLLVFLSAMKELPATLILSPLGFSSLSGQVWTNIGEAFFARASMPTLLLLLLSTIPLAWLSLKDSSS